MKVLKYQTLTANTKMKFQDHGMLSFTHILTQEKQKTKQKLTETRSFSVRHCTLFKGTQKLNYKLEHNTVTVEKIIKNLENSTENKKL